MCIRDRVCIDFKKATSSSICSTTSNIPTASNESLLNEAFSNVEHTMFVKFLFWAFKHPSIPGSINTVSIPLLSKPTATKPFPPPISKKTLLGECFLTDSIIQLLRCLNQKLFSSI